MLDADEVERYLGCGCEILIAAILALIVSAVLIGIFIGKGL
jgi:hypothetical protein